MSTSVFTLGEVAHLSVTVAGHDQAPIDPGVLRLKIRTPTRVVSTRTVGDGIVKEGIGQYHADVPLPIAGTWYYRWEGDAPNAGAVDGSINVAPSRFITP